jgi:hypothetical protein
MLKPHVTPVDKPDRVIWGFKISGALRSHPLSQLQ